MGLRVSSDGDNDSIKDECASVAAAATAAPSKSLDGLAREATMASMEAADGDTEFSREEKARKALECDCVAELRDGPCGSQFSEAFFCFLTSTADEQGSDCIKPFIAMQTCMAANPEAFVKYGDEADSINSNSAIDGECKPQPGGDRQDEPSVPSPPAGAVKNPIP